MATFCFCWVPDASIGDGGVRLSGSRRDLTDTHQMAAIFLVGAAASSGQKVAVALIKRIPGGSDSPEQSVCEWGHAKLKKGPTLADWCGQSPFRVALSGDGSANGLN